MLKKNDAPILIIFGQSNAHGYGTILPEKKKIITPCSKVKGLLRKDNQSYEIKDVTWSGFTTEGMNLGETQDHTCCVASEFARRWEKISEQKDLPLLYIIQISIGAQGINEFEQDKCNMWFPDRAPVLIPGNFEKVNISLYPLAIHILELVMQNLKKSGKDPKIIGLHWNQWETEVGTGKMALDNAEENYLKIFEGFRNAVGIPCPIYLYKPISEVYNNEEGRNEISSLFEKFANSNMGIEVIDILKSALWNPNHVDKGIFQEDLVHYNMEAHDWFAQWQMSKIFGGEIQ